MPYISMPNKEMQDNHNAPLCFQKLLYLLVQHQLKALSLFIAPLFSAQLLLCLGATWCAWWWCFKKET